MVDFTVAIPTYNGASRLPQLLDRLRSQAQPDGHQWEIVVVDNNSTDATADVVRQYQADWPEAVPLRYCFESEQGLAYARQKAIDVATAELVGFLDDDNLPAEDWVAEAVRFAEAHPRAEVYGGQIHGDYEVPPPPGFKRIQSFLAVRERGSKPHQYDPQRLNLPPGAAMVVRKSIWQAHVPPRLNLVGRVNGSSLSGEDYETLLHIHHAGGEIWYCPTMHTYHQIPCHRLERPYLLALVKGAGLCVCQLRLMYVPLWQKPLIVVQLVGGSFKRLLTHWLKYRQHLTSDLVAQCELAYFWSCVVSPVFYLRTRLSQPWGRSPHPQTNTSLLKTQNAK